MRKSSLMREDTLKKLVIIQWFYTFILNNGRNNCFNEC